MNAPEEFRTARLLVRRVVADDAEAMFRAFGGREEATRYLTWKPKDSAEQYREFLLRVAVPGWEQQSAFHWVLQRPDTPPIGMVSVDPGEHGVELGYVLSPDEWGKGLMTEGAAPIVAWALSEPGVHRVWATCDVDNAASARVLQKLGFEFEGTLRRWAVHPNVSSIPRDSYCYSRVK